MGDRLVNRVYFDDDFAFATYEHWSAPSVDEACDFLDGKNLRSGTMEDKIDLLKKYFQAACSFGNSEMTPSDYEDEFCQAGIEMKWEDKIPTVAKSEIDEVYRKQYNLPIGKDHTAGFFTFDEGLADYWESICEAYNEIHL